MSYSSCSSSSHRLQPPPHYSQQNQLPKNFPSQNKQTVPYTINPLSYSSQSQTRNNSFCKQQQSFPTNGLLLRTRHSNYLFFCHSSLENKPTNLPTMKLRVFFSLKIKGEKLLLAHVWKKKTFVDSAASRPKVIRLNSLNYLLMICSRLGRKSSHGWHRRQQPYRDRERERESRRDGESPQRQILILCTTLPI